MLQNFRSCLEIKRFGKPKAKQNELHCSIAFIMEVETVCEAYLSNLSNISVLMNLMINLLYLLPIHCHYIDQLFYLSDEDNPSKAAKVDLPTSQIPGGVIPGSLYPPQSIGLMPPK